MAELTREQIEDMRQFAINMCQYATERTSVAFGSAKFLVAVCDGALRALDQESDAKLGAAVRTIANALREEQEVPDAE